LTVKRAGAQLGIFQILAIYAIHTFVALFALENSEPVENIFGIADVIGIGAIFVIYRSKNQIAVSDIGSMVGIFAIDNTNPVLNGQFWSP